MPCLKYYTKKNGEVTGRNITDYNRKYIESHREYFRQKILCADCGKMYSRYNQTHHKKK